MHDTFLRRDNDKGIFGQFDHTLIGIPAGEVIVRTLPPRAAALQNIR